jgi:hypothetical protein
MHQTRRESHQVATAVLKKFEKDHPQVAAKGLTALLEKVVDGIWTYEEAKIRAGQRRCQRGEKCGCLTNCGDDEDEPKSREVIWQP